jgi:hypothetical protein
MQLLLHPLELSDGGRLRVLQGLHGLVRAPLFTVSGGLPVFAFSPRGSERFARFGEGGRKLGALGVGSVQRLPHPRNFSGVRALRGLETLTLRRERLARLIHLPGPMLLGGIEPLDEPPALRLKALPGRLEALGALCCFAAGGLELLGEACAVALQGLQARLIGVVPVIRRKRVAVALG